MAKVVIEAGLNPVSQDIHGQTALFYASRDGKVDIMTLLM
jgi:ankyrin repeat protein